MTRYERQHGLKTLAASEATHEQEDVSLKFSRLSSTSASHLRALGP